MTRISISLKFFSHPNMKHLKNSPRLLLPLLQHFNLLILALSAHRLGQLRLLLVSKFVISISPECVMNNLNRYSPIHKIYQGNPSLSGQSTLEREGERVHWVIQSHIRMGQVYRTLKYVAPSLYSHLVRLHDFS